MNIKDTQFTIIVISLFIAHVCLFALAVYMYVKTQDYLAFFAFLAAVWSFPTPEITRIPKDSDVNGIKKIREK